MGSENRLLDLGIVCSQSQDSVSIKLMNQYANMPHTRLTSLFPYQIEKKRHQKLEDGLKEYRLLLVSLSKAMQEYLLGNYFRFDSLVGENSCQIRASLLWSIISTNNLDAEKILDKVEILLSKINFYLMSPEHRNLSVTLCDFLNQNELHHNLSHLEKFLVCSYILTTVRVLLPSNPEKKVVRNEKTDTKLVKNLSMVGSTFARDLTKELRKIISEISVRFIQDLSVLLPLPDSVVEMVSNNYVVSHNLFGHLSCLPCFWYTLVLTYYSISSSMPIVLHVEKLEVDNNYSLHDKSTHIFSVKNGKYLPVNVTNYDLDTPALVIHGSVCRDKSDFITWDVEFKKFDLKDLILTYSAAHRQYPDSNNDKIFEALDCKLFEYYKSLAIMRGCTLENPNLFFLVHSYCDSIRNSLKH